jgi:hypothetical protein
MAEDLFKRPPKAVIDYFERRGIRTAWRWTDMAAHEHALAFTVARTAGFDVIEDLRAAVRRAVVDGVSFDDFQKQLTPVLQQKGWWGRKIVRGPSGEKELVQLGSVRRLKTIYWANVASAHAAGEWTRIQETKRVLPYLLYKKSLAKDPRDEHLRWVGTILPVDDPWWRTHFPPNGWMCQCRVEQVGPDRYERADPRDRVRPRDPVRIWRDKRTGRTQRVPDGIDPGWQRNPGRTREIVAAAERRRAIRAAARPEATDEDRVWAARTIVRAMRATPEFTAIAGNTLAMPHPWPDVPTEAQRAWQRLRAPVAVLDAAAAERLGVPAATVIELTGADAPKMAARHGVTVADYDLVERILQAPDGFSRSANGKWRITAIVDGAPWLMLLKVTRNGEVYLNSYHRLDRNDTRLARYRDDTPAR